MIDWLFSQDLDDRPSEAGALGGRGLLQGLVG
jgi:hypothetical protein